MESSHSESNLSVIIEVTREERHGRVREREKFQTKDSSECAAELLLSWFPDSVDRSAKGRIKQIQEIGKVVLRTHGLPEISILDGKHIFYRCTNGKYQIVDVAELITDEDRKGVETLKGHVENLCYDYFDDVSIAERLLRNTTILLNEDISRDMTIIFTMLVMDDLHLFRDFKKYDQKMSRNGKKSKCQAWAHALASKLVEAWPDASHEQRWRRLCKGGYGKVKEFEHEGELWKVERSGNEKSDKVEVLPPAGMELPNCFLSGLAKSTFEHYLREAVKARSAD